MNHIWSIDSGYMKDIVSEYEDPKPAYTTISTLLKRLITKGHIGFKLRGRDKEYYAKTKKPSYFSNEFRNIMSKFFDNSPSQFASFFTEESDLTLEQLKELKSFINSKIEEKKY